MRCYAGFEMVDIAPVIALCVMWVRYVFCDKRRVRAFVRCSNFPSLVSLGSAASSSCEHIWRCSADDPWAANQEPANERKERRTSSGLSGAPPVKNLRLFLCEPRVVVHSPTPFGPLSAKKSGCGNDTPTGDDSPPRRPARRPPPRRSPSACS
ncbi:hypothetical protein BDZ88DRAFT_276716 [Geranomyces variabilis]|nr:hypothetical protein BDZ88DRAFT_276716 [Geranomyces variabilis]